MIILYNIILTLIFITIFPGSWFILRKYLVKSKFKFPNRKYDYWIHCASLGEVNIALRLIEEFAVSAGIAKEKILLSVTNFEIKKIVEQKHKETYVFPIDYFLVTNKFIRKTSPKVLLILETELWPNYIYYAKKFGCKIFLLNGRLTLKTVVLLNMFKFIFRSVFKKIDYLYVREKIDYLRFKKFCSEKKIFVTGNMKYDDVEDNNTQQISKENFGFNKTDFITTFGSMREGEEIFFKNYVESLVKENIKLILAPRHLNSLSVYESILVQKNIKYKKSSQLFNIKNNFETISCILVDTFGELKKYYYISDVVFVGGTLLPYGGHSIIEPASIGKATIFGPYIKNFLEVSFLLKKKNACIQIKTLEQLYFTILDLKKDVEKRNVLGKNAKEVIMSLKGVTKKNVEYILKQI